MPDTPKHAFTDRAGRTWLLVLNYGLAKEIRDTIGVDFANAHNGEALKQLATNDELLVATLFALIEDQAKRENVTPEEFAKALDGEVFEAAGDAIGEMLRLFTRQAARPVIEALIDKTNQVKTQAGNLAAAQLRSPEAQAAIDREMDKLVAQAQQALTATS